MRNINHTIRIQKMCRACINEQLGLSLSREDCQYWQYPGKCSSCGQVCNIVADLVFWQKVRLWFAKNKNKSR